VTDRVKHDRRAARRAETEARLVSAATELFVRDGYGATTLTAVAERAGVAARTVYVRFDTKAELLRRCIAVAIAGDDRPLALADREWMRQAMTAPTRDERIRRMASVTAGLMDRAGGLLRVAQQAEATEPSIAAAAQAGREDTARTLGDFWTAMHGDGLLPPDCDLEWLTATATVLAHADTYLLLTKTTSWDARTYESWLATTWTRLADSSRRP
jgi:AcrR family transcriptional regulator